MESRCERAAHALDHATLVFLPFAVLPLASWALSLPTTPTSVAVLWALLAWGWTIATERSAPTRVALLPEASAGRRIGAWELGLLAFVLTACVAYVVTGSRMDGITYNDGAYYYGVARHMAFTGRFEEPIVWHFLHPPEQIVHAPFDYWGPATTLLLVPSLALFGDTPQTANTTMAMVSAASLLAFWYLICRALPLRYRVTQLLALVLFAFSPALDVYRFQPESITVTHLFLLLALIAFCHRRFLVAILCGFAILLTRGDGLILFAMISVAALVQAWRGVGGRRGRVWPLVLVGFACMGTYALWSFVSFGTVTPPAPQRVPFLPTYWQVFDYVAPDQHPQTSVWHRFTYDYIAKQTSRALTTLRMTPFVPAVDGWLALAIVPALTRFRGRPPAEALIWVLCFGGYFLLAWVSGPGFAPVRTPYVFAPLVILAGALGVDVVLTHLQAWIERGLPGRGRALVVGAGVLGLCTVFLARLPVLQAWNKVANLPSQGELPKLDHVLDGEPVATNVPWYIISHTHSPAVSIPHNGEAAIEAILARYQVRWMVIFPMSGGRSRAVLDRIVSGERRDLGRFLLQRVPVAGVHAAVYRIRSSATGDAQGGT